MLVAESRDSSGKERTRIQGEMTSSLAAFDQLPSDATAKVSPFKIAIKDDALKELHTLLSLSKLAPITYEGLQDRRYGAPYDWLKKARSAWLDEFDW